MVAAEARRRACLGRASTIETDPTQLGGRDVGRQSRGDGGRGDVVTKVSAYYRMRHVMKEWYVYNKKK